MNCPTCGAHVLLKRCPHCGHGIIKITVEDGSVTVNCRKCGAGCHSVGPKKAIEKWNRRHDENQHKK